MQSSYLKLSLILIANEQSLVNNLVSFEAQFKWSGLVSSSSVRTEH